MISPACCGMSLQVAAPGGQLSVMEGLDSLFGEVHTTYSLQMETLNLVMNESPRLSFGFEWWITLSACLVYRLQVAALGGQLSVVEGLYNSPVLSWVKFML